MNIIGLAKKDIWLGNIASSVALHHAISGCRQCRVAWYSSHWRLDFLCAPSQKFGFILTCPWQNLVKFSGLGPWGTNPREVLECPFNKICERGSQWLITVTKKMCKCDVDDFGRATSQVQVFIWYIPIYSFGNIFIMYYKHLSNDLNAILNHYITKYLQKLKMTTKLWTFWSRAQCRFYGDTLASIVRNILRDEEKQIFWSDLSFIKWFLTKPVWHRGWRHYKAIAGNVLRDIGLFNQILIKMNKDIMKKFISASSDEKFRTAHNDVKIPLHPTVLNSASQRLAIGREQSGACIEKAASTVLP